ncbi:peptidoglycan DD-metalloendopeptidase family protein [Buchnera aphidicola]|uniref:Uncharacterized protein n=1 Tax=Buchnera aphidicola (Aphis nerii) TaxID=1241835 RepID=A0A4D6XXD6_9GAMM|nr:peptidoglycan DD-metalloendopeptidase family protein [Buchnera aphidicola]QCI18860.1 hypothetical protein D9V64_01620 [Buchnera aphidicola (Aphis nerii)]
MQHIYKQIYLYFNCIFIFFIRISFISIILSSCTIISEEKKILFNQVIFKKNHNISNNEEKKIILYKKNTKIKYKNLKNHQKIKNLFDLILDPSKNKFTQKIIHIKKNSNFFNSAYASKLNLSDINTIIKAIEWQVSFRKINVNSTFHLIYLKKKTNSKKNKNILLGIKVNNLDKTYYAIRAPNGNFYDENGVNKSKIIMNFALLKKYRISSHFNLHRFHPVTQRISRHLGVDLAMPKGTLVLATSSGKIIKTGFNNISGFYIVINNQNQCITKYMHLKKILVKAGENIQINQKIALSGDTGRTTGPHLHYEIWINKHAINPIYAQSFFVNELTKKERIAYFKISKIILSILK